jgi:hypothetical protein
VPDTPPSSSPLLAASNTFSKALLKMHAGIRESLTSPQKMEEVGE